ncbi:DNA-binding transcriptional LysR family regulator [Collimonas sp. PA-H2]|uniref:LysR family transcriptional regulator n=1 Tax=Collimonas sp. PA-H2 TaxID=1881062 RepID=UPI000BF54724|nr:LysR family transcriptional regulator [Collimonas sp. PA-H2]PFH10011.1 DNA-binding transcriptional LysR family regulator [Collimonas sp. PA-H2]
MKGVTIHQLRCFDAVVEEGGFQAAAEKLHRTHPTICIAVKVLEEQLGICLFDRSGYRVTLTEAGQAFHHRAQQLLREVEGLDGFAANLAAGEEAELGIVIGDLCPLPEIVGFLRNFFDGCKTRLHLHCEAISGPWERLFDGSADLIVHHIDQSDARIEFIELSKVRLVPVVAPGFIDLPVSGDVTQRQMRDRVQCIIRDTARHSPQQNYFLIDGSPRCTVGDQFVKKEVILQGMAWGHMPHFMIAEELRDGRLLSIAGKHFPGNSVKLVAARLRDGSHGPVANRLWDYFSEQAGKLDLETREMALMNLAI